MLSKFEEDAKKLKDMFNASHNTVFWANDNRVDSIKEVAFTYFDLLADHKRLIVENKELKQDKYRLEMEANDLARKYELASLRLDTVREALNHDYALENIIKEVVKL